MKVILKSRIYALIKNNRKGVFFVGEEKNHGNVTINLKIKKAIYLKILQIKIVSFFSKKKAEEMYINLNGNDFVKLKSII